MLQPGQVAELYGLAILAGFGVSVAYLIPWSMLPDVIEWCRDRNIVCVPGCQTHTELTMAYRHGAPLQKLFPGVAGGPMWVKAVSSALVSIINIVCMKN